MSASQRNKGSAAERELAGLILDNLGVRMIRNLEQTRGGGYDLIVAPTERGAVADTLRSLGIEVKRHERTTPGEIAAWWSQAEGQANKAGLVPVLAYRASRRPWAFVVPLWWIRPDLSPWPGPDYAATVPLAAFCCLVREAGPDGYPNDQPTKEPKP